MSDVAPSHIPIASRPGPLLDSTITRERFPAPDYFYRCCTKCCVALGGWSLLGCYQPDHCVWINLTGYNRRNFNHPHATRNRPWITPIVSPLTNDLTRPAGMAYRNLITDGWEEGQRVLKQQAEARFHSGEGTTVFVVLWTEEATEPLIYMRVVREGKDWSLKGDYALHNQLDQQGWARDLCKYQLYSPQHGGWRLVDDCAKVEILGIGACLYIKHRFLEHTPLLPILIARMFTPTFLPLIADHE